MLTEQQKEAALKAYEGNKPVFMKGKFGHKYDTYKCGNCGNIFTHGVCESFCHNCGHRILWDSCRCLTR